MLETLSRINGVIWGMPALIMILGVGLYISWITGFVQIRLFPVALRLFWHKLTQRDTESGTVSGFQALCTALAATVGTGNIAGVAGAIAMGGPGAIFWMWMCAVLGMVTKFAEAVLAIRFRHRNEDGEWIGGPMYMIRNGLPKRWHWLGSLYCVFGVVAAFGVGNATQINAVTGSVCRVVTLLGYEWTPVIGILIGICFATALAAILLGGAKRIGSFVQWLVPFASVAYLLLCCGALWTQAKAIPSALSAIVEGAFQPRAVTGGVLGSAFIALRVGVSRGVFTNEAGMGTASIAHASANTAHPVEQGLMGVMEVFLDTIVICTMTALVILTGRVYIPFGTDEGVELTIRAFEYTYGQWVGVPIAFFLCCFAFATMLGWGLYGMRCAQYVFGNGAWKPFVLLQIGVVVVSVLLKTGTVWLLSEIVNGLMSIPNLIALAMLSPELVRLNKQYTTILRGRAANGGTNENFDQCKSLRTVTNEKIPSFGGGSSETG